MRRLPPLTGLEAFAAVARLGSIKAAASELSLSNPALSRRIQGLERVLGRALFDRHHQALRLTEAGRRLQGELIPALDDLSSAIDRAVGQDRELRLRLNVLPLFASQRLFPRLPELRKRHPELHLDVETMGHGELRLGDAVDAAIILTDSVAPDLYAVRLGTDKILPIVAKSLVEGRDAITAPEQIQRLTVLIHSEMPQTFDEWKKAIGMPYLEPAAIDHFDSGPLMLEAAAQGVGVAFMHGHHLDDARDDRLTRLFDFDVESPYAYHFTCRPRALGTRAVRLFHDWLVSAEI